MKRIGKRLTACLAFAVASGITLGGLVAVAPEARAAGGQDDLAAIEWQARTGLFNGAYSNVRLDVERLERVHEGMTIPKLRNSSGQPIEGVPHFFLGKDPETGAFLPEDILMCIDMLHVTYQVPDGSEYFDLATLVPRETAVGISQTLNAGLQLAKSAGLRIATDGTQPLTFATDAASDVMLAAQLKAWHLFARDNSAEPLPGLELRDFSVDKRITPPGGGERETIENFDLSDQYAQIDELVRRYREVPAFSTAPIQLDGTRTTVTDPVALSGFELEVDPATSTSGYERYISVATKSGKIEITRVRPLDRPLTIGFRKKFAHGLGADGAASGVRAANDQIKTVLANVYTTEFSLPIDSDDGSVTVRKSDAEGNALDDAEFTLFDSTGTTVARDAWGRRLVGSTGADGHGRLIFVNVPAGRYILVETRAPDGYQVDPTPREITVAPGAKVAAADGKPIVNTRLSSDLEIHKSNGVSVLRPGELTTYEIAIANRSTYTEPVDAVVEDVLPDGLRFVSADHGGSYDAESRIVSWNIGPVGATPIVVSVTARVEDSVAPGTTISNRATVTLDGVCPGYDDLGPCQSVDTDVVPALVLMKSNGTDAGLPGTSSTYELTVVNTSSVDAPDVVIVDTLPEELVFVAADEHGHYAADDHEITWRLGTLAAGEQRSVHVVVWVDDHAEPGSEIVNIASVSSAGACSDSATPDGDPSAPGDGPLSTCAATDLDRVPAVSITKDDGRTTVLAGERLDYRIVATNTSDVTAPDVVVIDHLPYTTSFIESSVPLAEVSTASILHWDLGDLAAGESREIVVSVVVSDHALPGTAIVNTVAISAAGVCVDDSTTDVDECTAVDEDTVVSPPVQEGETPDAPAELHAAGTSPAGTRLADTGQSLALALELGGLAAALLTTAGVSALALRRLRRRRSV